MALTIKRRPSKKAVIIGGIAALLVIAGINGNAQNSAQQPHNSSTTIPIEQTDATKAQKAPVVETKTIIETESIPFGSQTQNDATLESGKRVTATNGVNGEKSITYTATYTDGIETSRVKTSEQVTKEPTSELIKVGTKVALSCPNGTYINSAGDTVCSPYASSSAPSGASAQCRDGSYSFSQSRSGTCSHHGGVSIWY